jgi:hypothetical protein
MQANTAAVDIDCCDTATPASAVPTLLVNGKPKADSEPDNDFCSLRTVHDGI